MDLSLPQIWLIIGLLLLLAELVSVVLVFVFFAIAAFITALLSALGLLESLEYQIFLFSILSVASTLLLRKPLKDWVRRSREKEYTEYTGETAMVINDIPPDGEGKIFYRGAEWIALSNQKKTIEAGSKVIILRTEGIKLIVEEAG